MKIPKVSVLMPVYNCELYIEEAIDSILNQTFSDFELLIIDDASSDSTVSIIKTYEDCRIQLIEKPQNSGYTNSLNYGLSIAKGQYIARMDGDDISLPERFAKQVAFLDANAEIVLCGSNYNVINRNKIVILPEKDQQIKLALLRGNCIAHPSVMIRNSIIKKNHLLYNAKTEPAEDYDFWVRLLKIGSFYNIQEVLLNYRIHNTQVSQKKQTLQLQSSIKSRLKMFMYLNYSFNDQENDLLKKIIDKNYIMTFDEINEFFLLKEKMILTNSNGFFDPNGFQEYLLELQHDNLIKYFVDRERFYPINFYQYLVLNYKYSFKLVRIDKIKLMIKSIICYRIKK